MTPTNIGRVHIYFWIYFRQLPIKLSKLETLQEQIIEFIDAEMHALLRLD